MRELHSHVPQSAESNNAHLLALAHAPMPHRRVSRNARAQQRCCSSQIQVGWNLQDKVLIHHNRIGVPAVRNAPRVLVRKVIGQNHVVAELLKACLALRTGPVRVHHASHSGQIPGLELRHRRADLRHPTHNLMAGHARIDSRHHVVPLIPRLMQVRVTDSAE